MSSIYKMPASRRRVLFFASSFLLIFSAGTAGAEGFFAQPCGQTVEYIREPAEGVQISDRKPEYSWIVPQEAQYQKAYQIIVSSSIPSINRSKGDIWDSGKVLSDKCVNIEHAGKSLERGSEYYWKVRIWDSRGRVSLYSPVQKFAAGDRGEPVSTQNSFQIEHIAPESSKKISRNTYFFDFARAAFGSVTLKYQTEKHETLKIRLGEKSSGGRVDTNPGGSIRYKQVEIEVSPGCREYEVELPADTRNTGSRAVKLPESFGVVMPFRYCEIIGASSEITEDDIRQKAFFYYFQDNASAFSSSSKTLNKVWQLCKYSIKATSFAGLYVDGDRERIPYEADAYINQLSHYCTDREYAMAKQTIEYFMDHPTWPTEWILHTAMMVYQDYMYTGDTELIENYYDILRHKSLIALAREDGLISTQTGKVTDQLLRDIGFDPVPEKGLGDIVDWPPAQKDTGWKLATEQGERDGHQMLPINTVVNAFFCRNMQIMAEFAEILNKKKDRRLFTSMAAKVKEAINSKLFDKDKGIYIDGEGATHSSLHSNMLPLAFDIVPEEHKKSVAEFVESRGMACSVYGAQYLLQGLFKAGKSQYALSLITAKTDRSWWNMIEAGSTVTLEAWDLKYKPNADWNHAWGAAPANVIPRWLWGIRPNSPGFESVVIQPQLAGLERTKIKMPTIRGSVECSFEKTACGRNFSIKLPANTDGIFRLDDIENKAVFLSGKEIKAEKGAVEISAGKNEITIKND
ncbi:alpha-L-rhamnosidase C-terminal domain-containing protein [Sedimentisphaera salicampi]|uniref:alpha-L-rhamnosidase n=1 Tax=Sedimentisphaera salicampi TaxID=1941349 RepID=A0A1W6LPN6_9BACT|nr:alpha-L-rhamnosidase C-terminal domain-containing protein [Sedimentisphaera salicampi]ARN57683.1 Bacterial alpha-L-rhamnosidase [Sedimentisphaera salicampi]